MNKKITIYTKYCLSCLHPEEHLGVIKWSQRNNIKIEIRRTTYHPIWHIMACKKYGSDDYRSFVIYNRKVIDFMEFAKECKNKFCPEGKEKDDLLGSSKTKRNYRKHSMVVGTVETPQKNED